VLKIICNLDSNNLGSNAYLWHTLSSDYASNFFETEFEAT
jgi:hypothetical protein